ncbi:MAG: hypothetical protein AB7N76_03020 [Planctomycetota bacterium]
MTTREPDLASSRDESATPDGLRRANTDWLFVFVPYALAMLVAAGIFGSAFAEGRVVAGGEVFSVVEPEVELGAIALLVICFGATVSVWFGSVPMCLANLADARRRAGRLPALIALLGFASCGVLGFVYYLLWGRLPPSSEAGRSSP